MTLGSRGPIDLRCREAVEMVTDYLADALPAVERARFEQHLHVCPGCMTYFDQVRETIARAADLGRAAAPAPVDGEEARRIFRASRAKRPAEAG